MAWGTIAAAGISALGSLSAGQAAQSGTSKANRANYLMAKNQMAFQERMARHAHRYEVNDLRKAGLNPILSGTGGGGAPAASGSTAKMESEEGAGVASALDALAKITQALLTQKEAERTEAETKKTEAQTVTEQTQPALVGAQTTLATNQASSAKAYEENIRMDTKLKDVGRHVAMSELDKNQELTKLFKKQGLTQDQQTRLMGLNADQAAEVLKGLRLDGQLNDSEYGKALRYIDRTLDTVNKVPILNRFTPDSKKPKWKKLPTP